MEAEEDQEEALAAFWSAVEGIRLAREEEEERMAVEGILLYMYVCILICKGG